MKIILTKDVAKLGKKFDIKQVNDGYALNMLIPKGFAIPATDQAMKKVELEKSRIDGDRKMQEELLAKNMESLENISIEIKGKANEKGHLFASVHKEEIAKDLELQTHIQIDPSFINLEQPLKEIGEHKVKIKAGGRTTELKVNIEAL